MKITNWMLTATLAMMSPLSAAETRQVPLADFYRYSGASESIMSPAGRYVAVTTKGGANNLLGLVLMDLTAPGKSRSLALYADADVDSVRWVNDDRLVFRVVDSQSPAGEQIGGGLFVVDREGKDLLRNLIRRQFSTDEIGGMVAVSGGLSGPTFIAVIAAAAPIAVDAAQIGSQYWVVGDSKMNGRVLDIASVYSATGTGFGANLKFSELAVKRWGSVRIELLSCTRAKFSWNSVGDDTAN